MWHLSNHKFALESFGGYIEKEKRVGMEKVLDPFFYVSSMKKCQRNVTSFGMSNQSFWASIPSDKKREKWDGGDYCKALNHNLLKNVWTYKKSPPSGHDWTLWTKKKRLLFLEVLRCSVHPGFLHEKNLGPFFTLLHVLLVIEVFGKASFLK